MSGLGGWAADERVTLKEVTTRAGDFGFRARATLTAYAAAHRVRTVERLITLGWLRDTRACHACTHVEVSCGACGMWRCVSDRAHQPRCPHPGWCPVSEVTKAHGGSW